jgi:transcription initiation factor TFIIIB Brf1 subunit/transcription initiation factor TFIIB
MALERVSASKAKGKSPVSVAAACIYMIGQLSEPAHHRSFMQLAQVTGVTEATIRKAFRDLHELRARLVPGADAGVSWQPVITVEQLPAS